MSNSSSASRSPSSSTTTTTATATASTSSSSSAVVAVSAALAGVAVGLVLPGLCRRLRSPSPSVFRNDCNNKNNSKKNQSVNAVRAGLNGDDDDSVSDGSGAVRLNRDALDDVVAGVLVGAGCRENGARLTARVLSYADARGIPSHGANRADACVHEIRAGLVDPHAVPRVEKCSGGCAVVNGNNGLGTVTAKLAVETALRLAREHGVGVVACRASNHYGAAGYWAQMALDRGLLGLAFTNTSPIAVPTRSRVRGLGTNPFCFMAPAAAASASASASASSSTAATVSENENDHGGDSFQLDMATTTVPIGKVEVMDRMGKPVPLGWGVDRHGRDCTDGAEICKFGGLYPLGGAEETAGYKGYGLGMFVEILSSVLSGAAVGPDVLPWTVARGGPLNYGHCFVVLDPARFTPGFEERLGRYLDRMRNLPGDGGDDVLVAGDPEKAYERDAAENGVLLHRSVATTLKALAKRYNVTVPPELESLDETKSKASLYE